MTPKSLIRSGRKLATFAALVVIGATCGDLATAPGIEPTVVIQYAETVRPKVVFVGDEVPLAFDVLINGTKQARARYVLTSRDTSIIEISSSGDLMIVKKRGNVMVVATLVGATIGTDTTKRDSVLVAAQPFSNNLDPATEQTLRSLTETFEIIPKSLDRNGVDVPGGKTEWVSRNPAVATVVKSLNPDQRATVTAVSNGQTYVVADFDDGVDRDSVLVTVAQQLKKYRISTTRFGDDATMNFKALTDTVTVRVTALDSLNNRITSGFAPTVIEPTKTNVTIATTPDPFAVILTTATITDQQNPTQVCARHTPLGINSCVGVTVEQIATSLQIIGPSAITIPSIGTSVKLLPDAKDALGRGIPSDKVQWVSDNSDVVSVVGGTEATLTASRLVGTARVIASFPNASDTINVTVTNDPDRVEMTPPSVTLLSLDDEARVTARIFNGAGDSLSGITRTWTSLNPAIASVATSGDTAILTARATGQTRLVVSTSNAKTDTALVQVTNHPATINIAATDLTLASIGDKDSTFVVDLRNGRGVALARNTAIWRSSNVSVVQTTADGRGIIEAIAPGQAYVKAISPGADSLLVRDSVLVTVTNAPN